MPLARRVDAVLALTLPLTDEHTLALRALDTAAESDTATAGVDRSGKIYPVIKIVSREGITTLAESKIAAVFQEMVA